MLSNKAMHEEGLYERIRAQIQNEKHIGVAEILRKTDTPKLEFTAIKKIKTHVIFLRSREARKRER